MTPPKDRDPRAVSVRNVVCPRCGQRLRLEDDHSVQMEPGTEPLPSAEDRSPRDPRLDAGH